MVDDYGKLLDKQDEDSVVKEEDYEELHHASKTTLANKFLGRIISKQLSKKGTLFTGPQWEDPKSMVPFLYFHNSLSLQICPQCPQAKDPSLIRPFIEKGLISVFMLGRFSDAPDEFQKLAFEYPEYFVGPRAYYRYRYFSMNLDPSHMSIENHTHYCAKCISEKIEPYKVNLTGVTDEIKRELDHIEFQLITNPIPMSEELTDLYIDTIKNPDINYLEELHNTTNLLHHMTASYSLHSTPQINADFLNSTDLFVKPLRLDYDPNIDLNQYLELVHDFKGTLDPDIIPKNPEKILSITTRINEEVEKIVTSKRLPLGNFLSTFILDAPLILSKIIGEGTYGFEGSYKSALTNLKSPRLSEIKSNILSKYFGVSKSGIQIWQIRNMLK